MAFIASPDNVFLVQVTSPFAAAIPNSSGIATLANGDACRHVKLSLNISDEIIESPAKTGARGVLAGTGGRKGGDWDLEIPWSPSGTAGTVPDMDPLIRAMMGADPTVNAGTSVAYALGNTTMGLTLWDFKSTDGAQMPHRVGYGALVSRWEIATSDGALVSRFSGPMVYGLRKPNFAAYSTAAKGGLTAFPALPGSPSYTGNIVPGFAGSITLNGVGTFSLRDFSISGEFNRTLRHPYGSYYPTVANSGVRKFGVGITLYEEDVAALNTFRQLSTSKTTFDASIVMGDVAGLTTTIALNNVVLGSESVDDSQTEYTISYSGSYATMTNLGANDEITITLT